MMLGISARNPVVACCAFVVFLVGQIYALFAAVKVSRSAGSSSVREGAAAWRLGAQAVAGPVSAKPRAYGIRRAYASLAISFVALGVAASFGLARAGDDFARILHEPLKICGIDIE